MTWLSSLAKSLLRFSFGGEKDLRQAAQDKKAIQLEYNKMFWEAQRWRDRYQAMKAAFYDYVANNPSKDAPPKPVVIRGANTSINIVDYTHSNAGEAKQIPLVQKEGGK